MHIREIENICNLKSFDRYNYFIRKVADFEVLYSLRNKNGDFAISVRDDFSMLPLWSDEVFAKLNATCEWIDYEVVSISLDELQNTIFLFVAKNNLLINVFPINNKTGFVVNLEEFSRDLTLELEQYL